MLNLSFLGVVQPVQKCLSILTRTPSSTCLIHLLLYLVNYNLDFITSVLLGVFSFCFVLFLLVFYKSQICAQLIILITDSPTEALGLCGSPIVTTGLLVASLITAPLALSIAGWWFGWWDVWDEKLEIVFYKLTLLNLGVPHFDTIFGILNWLSMQLNC